MKKIVILIVTLSVCFQFYAQEKKTFEVDYKMLLMLDADEIVASIPAEYRSKVEATIREEIKKGIYIDYKLLTNGGESFYQLQPKLNNTQSIAGMLLNSLSAHDAGMLKKDLKNQTYIKEAKLMDSNYLIKDSLTVKDWKISKETAMVAGYSVRKANGVMNDSIKIESWFSSKIPIKDGPDKVYGLPGLILKTSAEFNGTKVVITATKVAVMAEEIKFKELTSGKTVSEKEFIDEMKRIDKKMREMNSGGVDKEN